MIILAIAALSAVVLVFLFSALGGIPSIPSEITQYVSLIIGYINDGCKIFYQFVYRDVVVALLGFLIAVTAAYYVYKFGLWLVKKIPMLGVSD